MITVKNIRTAHAGNVLQKTSILGSAYILGNLLHLEIFKCDLWGTENRCAVSPDTN